MFRMCRFFYCKYEWVMIADRYLCSRIGKTAAEILHIKFA